MPDHSSLQKPVPHRPPPQDPLHHPAPPPNRVFDQSTEPGSRTKRGPGLRVLFLADSHLGFDLPVRPRVDRRRRGHDFLANYQRALAPAREGSVDLVVHGGDVFHRSRVPPSLVFQAFRPLVEVAESGIPVFVVAGNHERSRMPHDRLTRHPNLHLFHRPRTEVTEVRGMRVAVSGFPYERRRIRDRFPRVMEETGWSAREADLRLLCMHHCVEGATVGPADFTFRNAPDVIRCSDLPTAFAAVLSGHIHRHQVLLEDLRGRALPTPVLYPGSVERTAFAELGEEKGFLLLAVEPDGQGGRLAGYDFVRLPDRPMVIRDLYPEDGQGMDWSACNLDAQLAATLAAVPREAVLRVRVHGRVPPGLRHVFSAAALRRNAPPEMNLEILLVADRTVRRRRRVRGPSSPSTRPDTDPAQIPAQLGMGLPGAV
ncbi:MAG: metallophosphoesterase family protein [Longimicrobiales bacterium]